MRSSVAERIVPAHPDSRGMAVGPARPAAAKAGIEGDGMPLHPTTDVDGDKAGYLALIDEARIRSGMSVKEMAIEANVDMATFAAALKGTSRQNFAAHWLAAQPTKWWMAFHKITADRYGLSPRVEQETFAERVGELVTLLLKTRRVE